MPKPDDSVAIFKRRENLKPEQAGALTLCELLADEDPEVRKLARQIIHIMLDDRPNFKISG